MNPSPLAAISMRNFRPASPLHSWRRGWMNFLDGTLDRVLALPAIDGIYQQVQSLREPGDFIAESLRLLGVEVEVRAEDLQRIPRQGATLVVSNHPFGGLDGMILAERLLRIRPDVKVLANQMLGHLHQLADLMIYVDPFGSRQAVSSNSRALKSALGHLKAGGLLVIFPAGEVSHLHLKERAVSDGPWNTTVARLARHTKAQVVPVHFSGSNSALFHLLGLIHPHFRTVMLPRELLKKRRQFLELRIGSPIPQRTLDSFTSDQELTAYLRLRTYLLPHRRRAALQESIDVTTPRQAMVDLPQDPQQLAREIAALPAEQKLAACGEMEVYWAMARQAPHLLLELGRLRELTFRSVGEGTGQARDLDAYDQYYRHLFIWSPTKQQVVGAYRLGKIDEILPRYGRRGLYTSTLYAYAPGMLESLGSAWELGRSFIRLEYQKEFLPLMLLWRGLATLCRDAQGQGRLIGAVSISNRYQTVARQLMVEYLTRFERDDRAEQVHPLTPPKFSPFRGMDLTPTLFGTLDRLEELVQETEDQSRGVPVLLRQYMRMGAKFLACNVDPAFSNALDALMLIELSQANARLLERITRGR